MGLDNVVGRAGSQSVNGKSGRYQECTAASLSLSANRHTESKHRNPLSPCIPPEARRRFARHWRPVMLSELFGGKVIQTADTPSIAMLHICKMKDQVRGLLPPRCLGWMTVNHAIEFQSP